jgi:HK97 family phage prohead protease
MKMRRFIKSVVTLSDVKMNADTGEFTCYGNTKNSIDHALDKTMHGAYGDSIKAHKAANTMPQMFYQHKSDELPVGVWLDWEEDNHGLKMKGRLSKTTLGKDIQVLANDGALGKFSIGYWVVDEKWNDEGFNELHKIHIVETSWVNRPCDENSILLEMKGKLTDGELPTKRELEKVLCDECGLTRRQAKSIANEYNPEPKLTPEHVAELEAMIGDMFKPNT